MDESVDSDRIGGLPVFEVPSVREGRPSTDVQEMPLFARAEGGRALKDVEDVTRELNSESGGAEIVGFDKKTVMDREGYNIRSEQLTVTFRAGEVDQEKMGQIERLVEFGYRDLAGWQYSDTRVHKGFELPNRKAVSGAGNVIARTSNALRMVARPRQEAYVSRVGDDVHQKNSAVLAVHIRGEKRKPVVGTVRGSLDNLRTKKAGDGEKEVVLQLDLRRFSRTEVVYLAAQLGVILSDGIEGVTFTGDEEDLKKRRSLFIHGYDRLLRRHYEPVSDKDMFGLDDQRREIETQLVQPLLTGEGNPHNLGFFGPPGTGKTLMARELMSAEDGVLYVPMPVQEFTKQHEEGGELRFDFEERIERAERLSELFRAPIVFVVDDAEYLFSSTVNKIPSEDDNLQLDTKNRQRILQILNGFAKRSCRFVYIFNHPEVLDSAADRRLYPVVFSLPDLDQREGILDTVVSDDIFDSRRNREDLVRRLAQKTDGFNGAFLAMIDQNVRNELLTMRGRGEEIDSDEMVEGVFLRVADRLSKRADVEELRVAEEAALRKVSSKGNRAKIGFKLPQNRSEAN